MENHPWKTSPSVPLSFSSNYFFKRPYLRLLQRIFLILRSSFPVLLPFSCRIDVSSPLGYKLHNVSPSPVYYYTEQTLPVETRRSFAQNHPRRLMLLIAVEESGRAAGLGCPIIPALFSSACSFHPSQFLYRFCVFSLTCAASTPCFSPLGCFIIILLIPSADRWLPWCEVLLWAESRLDFLAIRC